MKSSIKKVILSVVLISTLLLSGCLNMEQRVTVNKDGSGTILMTVTMDKEIFASMGSDVENPFDSESSRLAQAEGEKKGITFKNIETDNEIGIESSKEFDNPEDINKVFLDLYDGVYGEDVSSTAENLPKMELDTKNGYEFKMTLPVNKIEESPDMEGMSEEESEDFGDLSGMMADGMIEYTIVVDLPSKITDTNGTISEDGKSVTFKPALTETSEEQVFYATAKKSTNWLVIGFIIVFVIFVILAGVVWGIYFFRKSKGTLPTVEQSNQSGNIDSLFNAPSQSGDSLDDLLNAPAQNAKKVVAVINNSGTNFDGSQVFFDMQNDQFVLSTGQVISDEQFEQLRVKGFLYEP